MTDRDPSLDSNVPQAAHSRRRFIATAGAIAGAAVLGASAGRAESRAAPLPGTGQRGKAPRAPRDGEHARIAVIGPGGMGTGHVRAFLSLNEREDEKVHVVAVADVCDIHAKKAAEYANEKQPFTCDTYRDYREMLARDDIHGVLIASPEHWHAKHTIDAILAGKDVYCEKPMTLELDQALDLRKTVHANPDHICQIGTQKIMLPKYREAKKLIEQGVIGTPTFSQTSYCRNSPEGEWNYYNLNPDWKPGENLDWNAWLGDRSYREWDPKVYARWRRYRDFSTGIIGDLLVHEITPLIMALETVGWPVEVKAIGSHLVDHEMENHDQVNLQIVFESGHQMIVAGSTCNEVGLENMIRGHMGNIYLNSRHCEVRPTRPYVEEMEPMRVECPDIGSDHDQLRLNWLRCMRTREQPDSNVDLGTKVMVVVDLASRSMWDGHAYRFNPETMQVSRS